MGLAGINQPSMRDDPGRVAPPEDWTLAEQVRHDIEFAELKLHHTNRVRTLVIACLAGHIPSCAVLCQGRIQTLSRGDLYDLITEGADPAEPAQLFVAGEDRDAKANSDVWAMELIDAFVDKTAAHLASLEMSEVPA